MSDNLCPRQPHPACWAETEHQRALRRAQATFGLRPSSEQFERLYVDDDGGLVWTIRWGKEHGQ